MKMDHLAANSNKELAILYVDDDADDREFFAEALEKMDIPYKLHTIGSCMQLIDLLDAGQPVDIIFLDVNMPVKDGKQCLREIKAHETYRNIPVIIFTVSKSERDIDEVYNLGAHYHVIKPYAHINFMASLKIIFEIDWKTTQPIPAKEKFVINYSFNNA
jgi:CheY-like chemotaxis protein